MRKTVSFLLAACLCVVISTQLTEAQTSWKGTTSTSWTTASNWTAGVPTSATDVIIGDANVTGLNQTTISVTANCKAVTRGGTKASTSTASKTTTVTADILIYGNGTITHTGCSLTVKGNWINHSTYTATANG